MAEHHQAGISLRGIAKAVKLDRHTVQVRELSSWLIQAKDSALRN
ncbi:hypothetical protein [Nitrosococcus halophilus]|nr:hypothetical protein [Nitrosococcus halophilus]